jgi:3-hydroxyisobutyrate dehydrogenase-like beta-hydroxyacid dehydrogenase
VAIERVGFIGLGSHGWPMAANLAADGFILTVCDARQEPLAALAAAGATVVRTPREVAERSQLVGIGEIADPGWLDYQVEEVVLGPDGLLEGARPGLVVAFHAALYPSTVKRIAERAAARGVDAIDAQANGGAEGARARRLRYMIGGDPAVFERCRAAWATSGTTMLYMGGLGAGAAAKIAHYVAVCANLLGAHEAFALAEGAGVDLRAFQQLVHESAGQSWASDAWLDQFQPFDAARAENFYQRLHHALGLGDELRTPLPGTALAQQFMAGMRASAGSEAPESTIPSPLEGEG